MNPAPFYIVHPHFQVSKFLMHGGTHCITQQQRVEHLPMSRWHINSAASTEFDSVPNKNGPSSDRHRFHYHSFWLSPCAALVNDPATRHLVSARMKAKTLGVEQRPTAVQPRDGHKHVLPEGQRNSSWFWRMATSVLIEVVIFCTGNHGLLPVALKVVTIVGSLLGESICLVRWQASCSQSS